MVTEKLNQRKILCGCFRSLWLWIFIATMKRSAERWALQLYPTSLTYFDCKNDCCRIFVTEDMIINILENWTRKTGLDLVQAHLS